MRRRRSKKQPYPGHFQIQVERQYSTFVGIDLGGARGRTTAVARLTCARDGVAGVLVQEVNTRFQGVEPWNDEMLLGYINGVESPAVIAINAPLTVPACLRCQRPVCPGKAACDEPAVQWLCREGEALLAETMERDLDRIAIIPSTASPQSGTATSRPPPRTRPRIEPYIHRATEVVMHYERHLLPRDSLGLALGPIAARGLHLRRLLAQSGFELNRNLLEVSPRATVRALFDSHKARGYKRDADPWETRAAIVEGLRDVRFAPSSRMSREEVLSNDHCFEALLSGYTAYLWARDGWSMPEDVFQEDGWIWAPP